MDNGLVLLPKHNIHILYAAVILPRKYATKRNAYVHLQKTGTKTFPVAPPVMAPAGRNPRNQQQESG